MNENLIDAIASLVGDVSPLVVIFGFLSFAFRMIYDAISGGRIR